MKDLYDILQIEKDSSIDTIKQSYKKLAFQYHPDRNKSPNANDKFHNISQAYHILSNPDKKYIYDNHGYDVLQESSSLEIDPLELFRSIFNIDITKELDSNIFYFSDLSQKNDIPEHSMIHKIDCILEELYHGCKKDFSITHINKYNNYHTTNYVINIKPGTSHKDNILIKEGGNYNSTIDCKEDLVIEVNEINSNSNYLRKDNDLYTKVSIDFIESLCECELSFDLFGNIFSIMIPDIIQPNSVYKVVNKGMPIKYNHHSLSDTNKSHGDLFIDIHINYPTQLTDNQKEVLLEVFPKSQSIQKGELIKAEFHSNKQDIQKEIYHMEEESTGCLQQ